MNIVVYSVSCYFRVRLSQPVLAVISTSAAFIVFSLVVLNRKYTRTACALQKLFFNLVYILRPAEVLLLIKPLTTFLFFCILSLAETGQSLCCPSCLVYLTQVLLWCQRYISLVKMKVFLKWVEDQSGLWVFVSPNFPVVFLWKSNILHKWDLIYSIFVLSGKNLAFGFVYVFLTLTKQIKWQNIVNTADKAYFWNRISIFVFLYFYVSIHLYLWQITTGQLCFCSWSYLQVSEQVFRALIWDQFA